MHLNHILNNDEDCVFKKAFIQKNSRCFHLTHMCACIYVHVHIVLEVIKRVVGLTQAGLEYLEIQFSG